MYVGHVGPHRNRFCITLGSPVLEFGRICSFAIYFEPVRCLLGVAFFPSKHLLNEGRDCAHIPAFVSGEYHPQHVIRS